MIINKCMMQQNEKTVRAANTVRALHCVVLYCIVLYCIVLYCIVLYCIVSCCVVLCCVVCVLCVCCVYLFIYKSCKLELEPAFVPHHILTLSHRHRAKSKQYISMRRFVYRHIFGSRCLCSLSAPRHILVVVRAQTNTELQSRLYPRANLASYQP